MKKNVIIILSIIIVLVLCAGSAYLIDKSRMNNKKPVIFSTWGYTYAPPIEHENITEKIPNATKESVVTVIPIKENEDLFINLSDAWKYEVSGDETEEYEYAINFLNLDTENKMTLYSYKNLFGVCGTGLETKEITLDDGNIASVGYYDGNERWTFINLGDNIVIQNDGLTVETSNEALSMIKTMKYVKTHPGHIAKIDEYVDSEVNENISNTGEDDYSMPEAENFNNGKINIVTSLEDKLTDNAAWCGTFNLIWNDLKNDLAKQDIKFTENSDVVDNLNKGTFTADELSEDSYYKTYGTPTLELKKEIEKAIKEKFNETSDILDSFNWEGHTEDDYFLYSMLKKKFEYPKVFDKLENGTFENFNNVKYFGIKGGTKNEVREQVQVLYYNSEDEFALKIKTKGNDEIIVSVGNTADNFLDIYNNIIAEEGNYKGGMRLRDNEIFKMPYITFDLKEEITEVENKPFYFSNGDEYIIEKALQTIQFEINEKGGKVKSEEGMMVNKLAAFIEEPRIFNVDKTFTIFLIEEGKELPYFASKISDISSVQSDVYELTKSKK